MEDATKKGGKKRVGGKRCFVGEGILIGFRLGGALEKNTFTLLCRECGQGTLCGTAKASTFLVLLYITNRESGEN